MKKVAGATECLFLYYVHYFSGYQFQPATLLHMGASLNVLRDSARSEMARGCFLKVISLQSIQLK
jgi:hypothetical protein